MQSGFPISITQNTNTTGSQGGTQRPDSVLGQSTGSPGGVERRLKGYFNLAAQFGSITDTYDPRIIQVAAKLFF